MARIFISYRRADSKAITSRIYDRLVAAFGKKDIFKDVDSIYPGRDFRGVIREATAECRLMLVVIGPNWISASDANGNRRLDNSDDFVRIEVETGLQRDDILVIPLLVEGSSMPSVDQLPSALRELAYNNAFFIHDDPLFHHDMDSLIRYMRTLIRKRWSVTRWIALAVVILLVTVGVETVFSSLKLQSSTQPTFRPTVKATDVNTQIVAANSPESSATPRPTWTSTPKRTPTLMPSIFQGQVSNTVVVLSAPSINAPTMYSLLHAEIVQVYGRIEGSTVPGYRTNIWYLVTSRHSSAIGYVYSEFLLVPSPVSNPNATLPYVTLTPTS